MKNMQVNFEQPSDFVGETSSGGRPWLKWLGIGCAGISLIFALAMVFGGVKIVSCCSTMFETAKLTVVAEQVSQDFTSKIQAKEYAAAYEMMSKEHFQSTKNLEQFTGQFVPHEDLLGRSVSVVSGFEAVPTESLKDPQWKVTMRMLTSDGGEMLIMILDIGSLASDSTELSSAIEILDVRVDRRKRDISVEAPAVAAIEFHNLLRGGDYESAYMKFGREYQGMVDEGSAKMSQEMFTMFIKENESVYTVPSIEVVRIDYKNSNEAEVGLRVGKSGEPSAVVHYGMARFSGQSNDRWRVVEFGAHEWGGASDDVEVKIEAENAVEE